MELRCILLDSSKSKKGCLQQHTRPSKRLEKNNKMSKYAKLGLLSLFSIFDVRTRTRTRWPRGRTRTRTRTRRQKSPSPPSPADFLVSFLNLAFVFMLGSQALIHFPPHPLPRKKKRQQNGAVHVQLLVSPSITIQRFAPLKSLFLVENQFFLLVTGFLHCF